MITLTHTLALALLAAANLPPGAADEAPVNVQTTERETLAQDQLASGQTHKAIESLERQLETNPEDPALLINLGIAQARVGKEQAARALFERALVSPEPVELETADGSALDSRRLARKAIRMLEAGEFAKQLTRRD